MEPREMRRWYREHGMVPPNEDGSPEKGEAARPQADPKGKGLWPSRNPEDREYVAALEDFFEPYLTLLPRPKGNLIREYLGMRRTEVELAGEHGVSQQAVSQALRRAFRALVGIIALDDPEYTPPADKRVADYDGKREAAERVFDRYWTERLLREHYR